MTAAMLRCLAPAKINLFLHVTGRRDDGYHTLQTAFRMLDHGDWLDFRLRQDGVVRRVSEIPGVPAESDLVVRAARLLKAHSGCALGVDIRVDKRLPMGGGLGGGSSDAATTLLALNRLWGLGAGRADLQALGLQLGADVPFFVFGRSALAGGVGEALTTLDLPTAHYVVVEPPVSVPTAEIFRDEGLTRNSELVIISGSSTGHLPNLAERIAGARNDLESVATRRYPVIAEAITRLARAAGRPARMSGSGACVFAETNGPDHARDVIGKLASELHSEAWRVWSAASLDMHPLYDCAG